MPSDAGPGSPLDAGNAPGFRPDHLLADGQIVETGEVRIRAIATPGHASDHFAFAIEESGVLFPGDHVMAWATTVVAPPDGSMGAYLKSIERLLGESATVYLPAHGGEIRDPHAYLRALRAHRRMRERAVLECLHAGERRIGTLVDAIYPDLDLRLRQAARATTLAHLDHLAEHGLVEAGGPPGDPVYRVAGRGTGTAGAGPDGSASSAGAASSIP